jgi:hypothetical protein
VERRHVDTKILGRVALLDEAVQVASKLGTSQASLAP